MGERALLQKQWCTRCAGPRPAIFDDTALTIRCATCGGTVRQIQTSFDIALERTLEFEGWYSKHPADPGGETYRGIARRHHPSWPGWALIDEAKQRPGFPGTLKT